MNDSGGYEPGIMFYCPECDHQEFIPTLTLREIWEDDEHEVRRVLGLEPWVNLEDSSLDFLAMLCEWVQCSQCHKRTNLITACDEDEPQEDSGYGGFAVA